MQVEKGVEQMAKMLCRTLSTPRTPPAEAVEAIKHLLNLQADGARCAQDLDPVKLYMEAQVPTDSLRATLPNWLPKEFLALPFKFYVFLYGVWVINL